MARFSVEYLFSFSAANLGLLDRMGRMAELAAASMRQAGANSDALVSSASRMNATFGGMAGTVAQAGRALAGYANVAENAAYRTAAAQRLMTRDQAFMAAGFRRGADGNWTGGPPGTGGLLTGGGPSDRAMGGLAFAGFLSYFTGAGKKLFDTNLKFQTEFNNARAVMAQSTEADFAAMEQAVMALSKRTVFSATQIMSAMGELGSAGYEARDAMAVIPYALQMAQAGREPLAKTAEMLIAIKNQFGLGDGKLQHVNDVLSETSRRTLAKLPDLREAFKMAGPFAQIANVDLETTSALIGLLAQKGIKGSLAGTGLRRMETGFLKHDKKSLEFLSRYGIRGSQVYDTNGKIKDLVGTLELLEGRGVKAKDVMKAFGDRGGPILAALLETGSAAIRELTGSLRNSQGAAAAQAEQQMRGLPGAFARMKAAIEAARTSIGNSGFNGAMETLMGGVSKLVNLFSGLPSPVQMAVGWVGMFAAGLAALAMPAALLAVSLSALGANWGALKSFGPAVLRLSLLAAGIATAYWLYDNWPKIKEMLADPIKVDILFPELPEWLRNFISSGADPSRSVLDPGTRYLHGMSLPWNGYDPTGGSGDLARLSASAEQAKANAAAVARTMSPMQMFPVVQTPETTAWQRWMGGATPEFGNQPFNAASIPHAMAISVISEATFQPATLTVNVTGTVNGPVSGSATGTLQANPSRGQSAAMAGAPSTAGTAAR